MEYKNNNFDSIKELILSIREVAELPQPIQIQIQQLKVKD